MQPSHLAGAIEGEDLGPDEDKRGAQLQRSRLQQLQDIGEDANRERQVHSPVSHVQEASQQLQRPQPVHLTQQHLQQHHQLLSQEAGPGLAVASRDDYTNRPAPCDTGNLPFWVFLCL